MDGLVLSGVRGLVLSGVRPSCYQEYESAVRPRRHWVCAPLNLPNVIHLTGSRSAVPQWTTTARPKSQRQQPGFPTRRARP
ncbi:hypothetical protein G7047_25465 [Diaphorobacter sp. HDW4A]|nr:hypothetical protein G7047_25465 [Diaphorobacter sp. HDW4A]